MYNKFLTIAIPTYNRSIKLTEMLNDILICLQSSPFKNNIKLFISNNGSEDQTYDTLNFFSEKFQSINVNFKYDNLETNKGFDFNVFHCYSNSDSDYVWFISDDDKLYKDNFDKIIEHVFINESFIYYFNFSQGEVNITNPYIKNNITYSLEDKDYINSISKILYCPKLTSVIIKKIDIKYFYNPHKYMNYGFMHLYLILEIVKFKGNITFSKIFVATTSIDYLDSIRFPPYITNYYLDFIKLYTIENNLQHLFLDFSLGYIKCDPLSTNILYLGSYLRGNFIIDKNLYIQLKKEIRYDLINYKLNRKNHIEVFTAILKYLFSLIIYIIKKTIKTTK